MRIDLRFRSRGVQGGGAPLGHTWTLITSAIGAKRRV
jgi:hypothetical protein